MSSRLDLRTELEALTTSLGRAEIPYAVCGALALAIHGHPRATKDIALITAPDQIVALKAVARVHGFTLEALPMTFSSSGITVHRVSRLVGAQILTLDILDGSGVLAPVWNAREQVDTPRGRSGRIAAGVDHDEARCGTSAGSRGPRTAGDLELKRAVDMSPSAIEARLAAVSAQSPLGLIPPRCVDMSPEAVEARLEEWAELTALCLELAATGARADPDPG